MLDNKESVVWAECEAHWSVEGGFFYTAVSRCGGTASSKRCHLARCERDAPQVVAARACDIQCAIISCQREALRSVKLSSGADTIGATNTGASSASNGSHNARDGCNRPNRVVACVRQEHSTGIRRYRQASGIVKASKKGRAIFSTRATETGKGGNAARCDHQPSNPMSEVVSNEDVTVRDGKCDWPVEGGGCANIIQGAREA